MGGIGVGVMVGMGGGSSFGVDWLVSLFGSIVWLDWFVSLGGFGSWDRLWVCGVGVWCLALDI